MFCATFILLVTAQLNNFSTIDSENIVRIINDPIEKIEQLFLTFNKDINSEISIKGYMSQKVSEVLNINMMQNFLLTVFGTLGNLLVAAFSISFITFFFLKDQRLFFESILMWVPEKFTDNVTRALHSIQKLLTRYFIGIIIQSTCVLTIFTLGMIIIGIEFKQALVMGVIIGILNVIPYVGPWIGLFIVLIIGVAANINMDFNTVVLPLMMYIAIVQVITNLIDNFVLQPVIFSTSVKAHPLEIFIVVLASGFAAGIPGMILGIPAYTVLRVFAREFFYNFKTIQKITSSLSTEDIVRKRNSLKPTRSQ
jgi:predicted PurR-regulated permease PerM